MNDIRGRNYGNYTVIEIVLLVNSNLNVRHADDFSIKVKNLLKRERVYNVHVEPK